MIKKVIFICMVIICFCFANLSKTIEFNSDLLTISAVKTVENSNRYLNISYNNNTNTSIPGEPQLPIISKNYLISENDIPIDVDFKINKMTEFKLDALIEPGQNTTINELLPPNEDIYYSNSLYPQTPIKIFHDG